MSSSEILREFNINYPSNFSQPAPAPAPTPTRVSKPGTFSFLEDGDITLKPATTSNNDNSTNQKSAAAFFSPPQRPSSVLLGSHQSSNFCRSGGVDVINASAASGGGEGVGSGGAFEDLLGLFDGSTGASEATSRNGISNGNGQIVTDGKLTAKGGESLKRPMSFDGFRFGGHLSYANSGNNFSLNNGEGFSGARVMTSNSVYTPGSMTATSPSSMLFSTTASEDKDEGDEFGDFIASANEMNSTQKARKQTEAASFNIPTMPSRVLNSSYGLGRNINWEKSSDNGNGCGGNWGRGKGFDTGGIKEEKEIQSQSQAEDEDEFGEFIDSNMRKEEKLPSAFLSSSTKPLLPINASTATLLLTTNVTKSSSSSPSHSSISFPPLRRLLQPILLLFRTLSNFFTSLIPHPYSLRQKILHHPHTICYLTATCEIVRVLGRVIAGRSISRLLGNNSSSNNSKNRIPGGATPKTIWGALKTAHNSPSTTVQNDEREISEIVRIWNNEYMPKIKSVALTITVGSNPCMSRNITTPGTASLASCVPQLDTQLFPEKVMLDEDNIANKLQAVGIGDEVYTNTHEKKVDVEEECLLCRLRRGEVVSALKENIAISFTINGDTEINPTMALEQNGTNKNGEEKKVKSMLGGVGEGGNKIWWVEKWGHRTCKNWVEANFDI